MSEITQEEEIERSIRRIVRTLMGWPEDSIRKANQNAPTGSKSEPFATVLTTLLPAHQWGVNQITDLDDTQVKESVAGTYRLSCSIQFFRKDAYRNTVRLRTLLQTSKALELFRAARLGLVSYGPARNLSETVNTLWEERGQIDVDFYIVLGEVAVLPTYNRFVIGVTTEKDGRTATTAGEVKAP